MNGLSLPLSLFLSLSLEMETLMPVKDVAPIVAYLCHESFEENGSVIETTGGWVTKIKVQQGKGVILKKPHTMEDGETPSEIHAENENEKISLPFFFLFC